MTRRLQGRNNRKQDCRVRLLAFLAMTYVLFLLPTSNTPRLCNTPRHCEKDFSPTWQSYTPIITCLKGVRIESKIASLPRYRHCEPQVKQSIQDFRVRLLAFLAMTYVLFLLPTSNTPRLCEKDFSPTWQSLELGACPRNRKAHATLMSLIQRLILQKQDVAGFLKNAFIAHRQGNLKPQLIIH